MDCLHETAPLSVNHLNSPAWRESTQDTAYGGLQGSSLDSSCEGRSQFLPECFSFAWWNSGLVGGRIIGTPSITVAHPNAPADRCMVALFPHRGQGFVYRPCFAFQ